MYTASHLTIQGQKWVYNVYLQQGYDGTVKHLSGRNERQLSDY